MIPKRGKKRGKTFKFLRGKESKCNILGIILFLLFKEEKTKKKGKKPLVGKRRLIENFQNDFLFDLELLHLLVKARPPSI